MLNVEVKNRITHLLASGERRLLGIVGAPGAGKSTLVEAIAEAFGEDAVVVPMDGFHLSNAELNRLGRAAHKGAPDTFDVAGFVSLLHRIRQQSTSSDSNDVVYAPVFERKIEEAIASSIAILPRTPLVIVEGNYLLQTTGGWQNVRPILDECWYVDVDQDLRLSRLITRHVQFGRTTEAAMAWVKNTDEPNARVIEKTKHLADWLLEL